VLERRSAEGGEPRGDRTCPKGSTCRATLLALAALGCTAIGLAWGIRIVGGEDPWSARMRTQAAARIRGIGPINPGHQDIRRWLCGVAGWTDVDILYYNQCWALSDEVSPSERMAIRVVNYDVFTTLCAEAAEVGATPHALLVRDSEFELWKRIVRQPKEWQEAKRSPLYWAYVMSSRRRMFTVGDRLMERRFQEAIDELRVH